MFLDITASNENRKTIIDVVNKTAKKCFCLAVGGGIRNTENIRELLILVQIKFLLIQLQWRI